MVRNFNNNCARAYDQCAVSRDRSNHSQRAFRYFCSESFYYEDQYDYSWDYNDSFYTDLGDYDDDYYEYDHYYDDDYWYDDGWN